MNIYEAFDIDIWVVLMACSDYFYILVRGFLFLMHFDPIKVNVHPVLVSVVVIIVTQNNIHVANAH